ncbi:type I restriction endonuclease subunit R [Microscilla marina]|uniref:type I site-specific deoxyribonuclease n=1 Tax=Microscilla marina ATCC 23134 TaxID=313606 RepID=A1ZUE2_MICM2|nr:type I restriction endonuclease subunit R [Microscilla marina]EAY25961.1 type I site-specific deoxyribonuclease, HsdR family [Microscilla marina ATCC 23134]
MPNNSAEYRLSEAPAIEQFKQMGYQYYHGHTHDERDYPTDVVIASRLRKALKKLNPWLNDTNLEKAFQAITSVQGTSLMEINQNIWKAYLHHDVYTVKQVINGKEAFCPVRYIAYDDVYQNDLLVVNQLKFEGKLTCIPDLVVFVNGLPLAVLECKAPQLHDAAKSAFNDLQYYQRNVAPLFYYNQLCVGLWADGAHYGAIEAPFAFYARLRVRPDDPLPAHLPNDQAKLLEALFHPSRFFDFVRHFVLFEQAGTQTIKKLPRHQQIRAVNKTIERLRQNQGGVVWHTQGSGKSLTMAYLSRKLLAPEYGFQHPTIMILTDRQDLDQQITNTFRNAGFGNVQHAHSVRNLRSILANNYGGIVTTTLQKFQEREDATDTATGAPTPDQTTQEELGNQRIKRQIKDGQLIKTTEAWVDGAWHQVHHETIALQQLSTKENLYVLVDEAHRSQYDFLAAFMRSAMPHAKFVAFTGTPISKEEKSTLGEFYGGNYIDMYTIAEAVADGATVPLLYDQGIEMLSVKKDALDLEFDEKFGEASAEKKEKLKQTALRKYQHADARIEEISKHLVQHFTDKICPNGHKALLVCSGREAAVKYQQAITKLKEAGEHSFESKVIVSLGSAKSSAFDEAYHQTLAYNQKHPQHPRPVWVTPSTEVKEVIKDFKLPYGNADEKERSGAKKYDNTALLIVSDMLLTGYDAPIASCLYLDKPLKEHSLLQAIARVNRARKNKHAGFIVDYTGIAEALQQALDIFSGEVRPHDLLKNRAEEIPRLEQHHAQLLEFFKPIIAKIDRHYQKEPFVEAAWQMLEPIDVRDTFKILLNQFNQSLSIVLPDPRARHFEPDFRLFNEIRLRARNMFKEDNDLEISAIESEMLQQMVNDHLEAQGVTNLLEEPVSIIDKQRFREELQNASPATQELSLRNNLRYVIKTGMGKNPDFYKPLGERLDDLLKQHQNERIGQAALLKAYAAMQNEIINEQTEGKRLGFDTASGRALYNSMKALLGSEVAARVTHELWANIADGLAVVDWQNKPRLQNGIVGQISGVLQKEAHLSRQEAKIKALEMVEVLKKNEKGH